MKATFIEKRIAAGIAIAVLLAVVVTGALPAMTAYAQGAPAPGNAGAKGNPLWLEFQLSRAQIALSAQGDRLNRMGDVAAAVQSLIDSANAGGKDTTVLQHALATFKQEIQDAQAPHANAKSILDAKTGFDASGKVTDPVQARQTLKDAAQAMRDAHGIITPATKALRESFKPFINANRPVKSGDQSTDAGA